MRRLITLAFGMGLLIATIATPATATTNTLTPLPNGEGHWLAGGAGEVSESSGLATVNANGAQITVKAVGLLPGHAFTMWVVYFNDGTQCTFGEMGPDTNCGFGDLLAGRGGIVFGDGKVIGGSGKATFSAHVNVGDDPDIGPPTVVPYDPSPDPDFHIIIRSHGPKLPGQVAEQTHSVGGGCLVELPPGQLPVNDGECGDVQLYIFETVPA